MGLRSFIHRLTAPPIKGQAPSGDLKMVCVVNHGLKMGKGKIAAQVGHAAVSAVMNAGGKQPALLDAYLSSGQKKVCVKGNDADHLLELEKQAKSLSLLTTTIRDAGHTQIPSGSLTVLAIGPAQSDRIEEVTGQLKLL